MADVAGVSNTSDPNGYYSGGTSQVNNGNALDKDAFLKLLTTQLQYQDPMKPMDNQEFIAQMAQFSSLEQMQQFNTKMDNLVVAMTQQLSNATAFNATSFVGRTITAVDPDDASATPITGKVTGVDFESGIPQLIVGDQRIKLGWVTRVE